MVTRYLVELEIGASLHAWVDRRLYRLADFDEHETPGRRYFEFLRYGWGCAICVGQWISVPMTWGLSGIPPWEFGVSGWILAVFLNAVNSVLILAQQLVGALRGIAGAYTDE